MKQDIFSDEFVSAVGLLYFKLSGGQDIRHTPGMKDEGRVFSYDLSAGVHLIRINEKIVQSVAVRLQASVVDTIDALCIDSHPNPEMCKKEILARRLEGV